MKKKIFLLFTLLILLLSVCFSTFCSMSGRDVTWHIIVCNLAYNVPILLLMGFFDWGILSHKSTQAGGIVPSLASILFSTICIPLLLGGIAILIAAWAKYPFTFLHNVMPATLCNAIVVLLLSLYLYGKYQMESQQRLSCMEKEKMRYQFEALKNQVNPHFLFNSLNVLASLAYQDANKTNLFTKKLAEVYRYLLNTSNHQTVSLEEELRFTKAFLYLEEIRFGNALQVIIDDATDGKKSARVIPASLQMLVENAIKHNIATTTSPLVIHICISRKSIIVSNNLQLRSYVGSKNGIGLTNLRNQYILHGEDFKIQKNEKEFVVEMPFIQKRLSWKIGTWTSPMRQDCCNCTHRQSTMRNVDQIIAVDHRKVVEIINYETLKDF